MRYHCPQSHDDTLDITHGTQPCARCGRSPRSIGQLCSPCPDTLLWYHGLDAESDVGAATIFKSTARCKRVASPGAGASRRRVERRGLDRRLHHNLSGLVHAAIGSVSERNSISTSLAQSAVFHVESVDRAGRVGMPSAPQTWASRKGPSTRCSARRASRCHSRRLSAA